MTPGSPSAKFPIDQAELSCQVCQRKYPVPAHLLQPLLLRKLFSLTQTKESKKKGRKKWSEKHKSVLQAGLSLFGEDITRLREFLPEFNERSIRRKIVHIDWKSKFTDLKPAFVDPSATEPSRVLEETDLSPAKKFSAPSIYDRLFDSSFFAGEKENFFTDPKRSETKLHSCRNLGSIAKLGGLFKDQAALELNALPSSPDVSQPDFS